MGMAYVGGLCPSQQSYKLGSTYNTNLCERQVGGARSGFVSYNLFSNYILQISCMHTPMKNISNWSIKFTASCTWARP